MRKSALTKDLTAFVQARYPGRGYFETIAGFNSSAIARAYITKCEDSNRFLRADEQFTYKLVCKEG